VQPLGQGGFGRTYLALDEDRLGTHCVIKQFSPQIQGTKSLEKAVNLFIQEAVRLHELGEHSQIPTLLAYFEQDKYLYLVQQFIEGQNLLQVMKQEGPFNERKIRDVLADLLPVLRFVHHKQVIHRDITPTNILRRPDGRLVLIDFGVAKQINVETAAEPGTRIGTEGYTPMEQFRGGRAYPASDLYSLGATCIHLMTQIKPDSLYDPLNGHWIWREHLQEKGVVVSDQLAYILDNMLKDLVAERYQSADEVMRDLNADSFTPQTQPAKSSGVTATSRPPMPAPGTNRSTSTSSRPPMPAPQATRAASPSPRVAPAPLPRPPLSKPPVSQPPNSRPPLQRNSTVPVGSASWRCARTLTGHTSWVTAIAFAPGGQILTSSGLDDAVRVWNVLTGELIYVLKGHHKGVNAIAISPNGRTLTSGSDDYSLKTWNLQNGSLMRTLTGHSRNVNAVVISPDGQLIASGGQDRTIRLWQMGTGNTLRTILSVGSMVKSLAITPDGKMLISGGFDNKIKFWSLQTGDQLRMLSGHLNAVNALAISADGQTLASGSRDKSIRLWNLQTGALISTLADHTRDVNTVAFSPDGQTLVSGSSDTTIKIWNWHSGQVVDTIQGHNDSVNSIAINGDGRLIVSGSSDSTIRIWQMI
jgi:WD40 repeat protein/tRNA A-37 threonylcarbamoyl transferase component Bud32